MADGFARVHLSINQTTRERYSSLLVTNAVFPMQKSHAQEYIFYTKENTVHFLQIEV